MFESLLWVVNIDACFNVIKMSGSISQPRTSEEFLLIGDSASPGVVASLLVKTNLSRRYKANCVDGKAKKQTSLYIICKAFLISATASDLPNKLHSWGRILVGGEECVGRIDRLIGQPTFIPSSDKNVVNFSKQHKHFPLPSVG